jgi:hypothetical protein
MGEVVQGAWPGSGTSEPKEEKKIDAEERSLAQFKGKAKCIACLHEWDAISEEGSINSMECPNCLLNRGAMQFPAKPANGTKIWVCTCGSDIFYIYNPPNMLAGMRKLCTGCGATTPLSRGPK